MPEQRLGALRRTMAIRFCVGLLPFRHSFCMARGLTFAHEGVGFRAGAVVVTAWRRTRASGRCSFARTRSYPADQLLSDQLLSGFAAGKLGRRLYRPQWRLWSRTKQLVQLVGVDRQFPGQWRRFRRHARHQLCGLRRLGVAGFRGRLRLVGRQRQWRLLGPRRTGARRNASTAARFDLPNQD